MSTAQRHGVRYTATPAPSAHEHYSALCCSSVGMYLSRNSSFCFQEFTGILHWMKKSFLCIEYSRLCNSPQLHLPSPAEGVQLRAPFAQSHVGQHHFCPIWCNCTFWQATLAKYIIGIFQSGLQGEMRCDCHHCWGGSRWLQHICS